jgi:hypothetical protein
MRPPGAAPRQHDQQPRRHQVQSRAVPRGHHARIYLPPLPESPPLDARGDGRVVVVEPRGAALWEHHDSVRPAPTLLLEDAATARGRRRSNTSRY